MEVVITRMGVWQEVAQGHNKGEEVRVKVHPIREEVRGEVHPIREEIRGEVHPVWKEAGQAREGADRAPVEVHQETGKI